MNNVNHPKSKLLDLVRGPDGLEYRLLFYGESELAAVVCAPPSGALGETKEVHREPATSAEEAHEKLKAWMKREGWLAS